MAAQTIAVTGAVIRVTPMSSPPGGIKSHTGRTQLTKAKPAAGGARPGGCAASPAAAHGQGLAGTHRRRTHGGQPVSRSCPVGTGFL